MNAIGNKKLKIPNLCTKRSPQKTWQTSYFFQIYIPELFKMTNKIIALSQPNMRPLCVLLLFILPASLVSCNKTKEEKLFSSLPSSYTGIKFNNSINENKFSRGAMNEFGYMGAGVGIGDFNNDGLADIFFTGNQVSSRLYINRGKNIFEDITTKAGLETDVWATGVSVVDINNDGYDDIYVCCYGKGLDSRAPNLLFINQQNNTFKEAAKTYGLADTSYSTQAAFFDYDRDGDLDMFLVNYNLNTSYSANNIFPKDISGHSLANDRLYRNDGNKNNTGHPFFTDVSMGAGIKEDGYGIGISVSDFNNDGWPDVYVANDFISNDELWLNNKNGTFTNRTDDGIKHQSYSSMGCDAADINNDMLTDIAVADMLPEDNERKKLTNIYMSYDRYEAERNLGYAPEFARNMLQLNNGNLKRSDTAVPFFSEIGQLAGISETDWSWSILFADFDNDGFKDMHVTNGIGRDFINSDFIQYSQTVNANTSDPKEARRIMNEKLVSLNRVEIPNYYFKNNGHLQFTNESEKAGINERSISSGAAYADLDNDGDLDLIVNNINREPFIFVNNNHGPQKSAACHSISFILKGDGLNTKAIGAKIYVYANGHTMLQELAPVRGYTSSAGTRILFGTGIKNTADSVVIVWPLQQQTLLKNLQCDSTYIVFQKDAGAPKPKAKATLDPATIFTDVGAAYNFNYKHTDVPFYDYANQRLLPQKFSQLGPFIATADVNADGLDDFFIGGGFNSSGQVFTQQENGSFIGKNLYETEKMREDMDCIFFDADGDADQDLLVTYGDMRYGDSSSFYHPQLFLNDGKGNFTLNDAAIPASVKTIAGAVCAADYDGDGDTDIFIGGRVSTTYPLPAKSFILENNGGIFTDVTKIICPSLQMPGMVTAALWTDFNNDKKPDLVIAGEWMPVMFFKNTGKGLADVTATTAPGVMNGMWRSLATADIDGDGDEDIIAGNLGLNCRYNATQKTAMKLFAKDIDGNGSIDPVMFYFLKDKNGQKLLFPSIGRDALAEQVPMIKKQFLSYQSYVHATPEDIFKSTENLREFTCNETASCWLENTGSGKFTKHLLPVQAQFAPINSIICSDMDADGIKDLLIAGNEYQTDVTTGRYDASYGLFLRGTRQKEFSPVSPVTSGFITQGDVKNMKLISTKKNEKTIIVAINNAPAKLFGIK